MDVMRFVLNTITKLTLAATGLVVALVVLLLETLTGHVRKRAHQTAPQQVPQPTPAKVSHPQPQPASSASPAVHVHVHIDQAHAQPAPPPPPAAYASNQSPPSVLSRPDHRIYVTTGSHLMQEHPACDELLERLDYMLYVAAHRDGDPFTVAPPLDDTRDGRAIVLDLPPVAAIDEGEFFSDERQALPPPDGALWLRRAGEVPQQLATRLTNFDQMQRNP